VTRPYQTQATAIGGQTGSAASADGMLRLDLTTPRELGGTGGQGTNPVQIFAAGYAASFLAALRHVAPDRVAADANVTATVSIGGGGMMQVTLDADLPGMDQEEGKALADRAHALCVYSRAVQDNLTVRVRVQ